LSVNLEDFPQNLANQLGIGDNLFAGQLLAMAIFLLLFLAPVLILTRNKLIHLIMAFTVISFGIAMTWFPLWSFAIICLYIAFAFGGKLIRRL